MSRSHKYKDYDDIPSKKFTSPRKYIKSKVKSLRSEFGIEPTWEELSYLYSLISQPAIDVAIRNIVKKRAEEA